MDDVRPAVIIGALLASTTAQAGPSPALAPRVFFGRPSDVPSLERRAGAFAADAARSEAAGLVVTQRGSDAGPGAAAQRPYGGSGAPASCIGDICAPRVSVPGFERKMLKPSRTELVASYLGRTQIEPLTSIAHALLVTGVSVDYKPPVSDGSASDQSGWGTLWLRLRFRIDASNKPVIPVRRR